MNRTLRHFAETLGSSAARAAASACSPFQCSSSIAIMATSALMESEQPVDLQEQARKAMEEARAAARQQERQAAAARQKERSLERQRLNAALKEHVEDWAARLGTTVSQWTTPTHTKTESGFDSVTTHWTKWVTATFTADGILFKATLRDGTFAGVRLHEGAKDVSIVGKRPIESLADLGEELDRLSKQRSKQRPRRILP
jgi:hypothetical protein